MNTTQRSEFISQDRGEQVSIGKVNQIKLGIDAHADDVRVVRQIDGSCPQPAQKFSHEQFLDWAVKQRTLAHQVYSCYEAGPFGYVLHRKLVALGVNNLVIRPQIWDELGRRVKTDKTDALALVQRLDRYVQGNTKALAVVRVPTPEQEQARWPSRQREQLRRHRQRLEAQGRSLLLSQGYRVRGRWWQERRWRALSTHVSAHLVPVLQVLRNQTLSVHQEVEKLTDQLEAVAPTQRVKGLGGLSMEVIRREVLDWGRFTNRRQVASFTGLCPSVYASGRKMRTGSITKHGNPRLRHALIEAVWRLMVWQPNYWALVKWRSLFNDPNASKGRKKKAVVAVARHLAIDLWRMATGRCTAAELGLSEIETQAPPEKTQESH